MKIDDLITEAPMGFLSHATNKLKSFVPGGYGAKAQGTLDVGRVANKWYKDYMLYLGKVGADGFGSTRTFMAFLRDLGFTDDQLRQVLNKGTKGPKRQVMTKTKQRDPNKPELKKSAMDMSKISAPIPKKPAMDMSKLSSPVTEAQQIYEAMLTSKVINTLMIRAARVAAAARYGTRQALPDEPNPTAPREPGAIDTAVDIGKGVAKGAGKASGNMADFLKYLQKNQQPGTEFVVSKKSAPKQRIEPTFDMPPAKPVKKVTNYK